MYTYHKIFFLAMISATFLFTACGDDDTVIPQDEELITTLTITLSPVNGGDDIAVTFFDPDGDGGQVPTIGTLLLDANTSYDASVSLLNQSVIPAEDITMEILAEAETHQLFYAAINGLDLTASYRDQDSNGNPLGLITLLNAGNASTGNLRVSLRHEPDKNAAGVANGDMTNAGGETDIEVVFPVEIQ
jgi:hypothetical protein